jgi:hypothetical protein
MCQFPVLRVTLFKSFQLFQFSMFLKRVYEVNALPKESLRTVLDLITDPFKDDPYQQLKDRLCTTHQLTDLQRVEKLYPMDTLGVGDLLASFTR